MSPTITLKNISKHYGSQRALNSVSLEFHGGGFYVLLGKNGAGKSTLMRILMRYEQPDEGTGTILGAPLESDDDKLNLDIGYVSEALEIALPLRLNRLFSQFSEIYPRWDQKLFEGMLSELRIDLNKYFRELSRGQKMQVAFAAALAIHPKVLLLDEITAVLDANARSFFMDYLNRFTRNNGTVVMATNIVSEVQNFANHMVLLHNGHVNLDIPFSDLSKRFVKIRRRPNDNAALFSDKECVEVCLNSDGSTSHVMPRELADRNTLSPDVLDNRGITAEDIFIYFTRSKWR